MSMASIIVVVLAFVATAHAQNQPIPYIGNLNFEGSSEDYITGGKAYAFSEQTGKFDVALSQDMTTLQISYEDNIPAGEVFPENNFHLEFQAIRGYTLHTGKYTAASRFPFNSNDVEYDNGDVPSKITDRNGFNISGNGRGCNQLTADFEIKKMEVSPEDGQILNFEALFIQHCENGAPFAKGTISLSRGKNAEVKIQLN